MNIKSISWGILACIIIGLVSFMYDAPRSHAASVKEYVMGGAEFDNDLNVISTASLKTRNKVLSVKGKMYLTCNGKTKKLKRKKRTFKISKHCRFVCEGYDPHNTSTTYKGKKYKKFKRLCKYWMDGKGDKKTGTYNNLAFEVKSGKIVSLLMTWDPYEGG